MSDEETNKNNMKGTLHKTNRGWIVKQVIKEGPQARLVNQYPLVDNGHIIDKHRQITSFNCEGLEVDFEILTDYDNNGPEHFPKFAKLITPEEDELKDWDVTLMDGLENEPYVSDNVQIGSEGEYEHANPDIHYTKPGFVEKRINQMLEYLSNESFKNVGDEGLFPNHTDKDIWISGFKAGYLDGMRNERKSMK